MAGAQPQRGRRQPGSSGYNDPISRVNTGTSPSATGQRPFRSSRSRSFKSSRSCHRRDGFSRCLRRLNARKILAFDAQWVRRRKPRRSNCTVQIDRPPCAPSRSVFRAVPCARSPLPRSTNIVPSSIVRWASTLTVVCRRWPRVTDGRKPIALRRLDPALLILLGQPVDLLTDPRRRAGVPQSASGPMAQGFADFRERPTPARFEPAAAALPAEIACPTRRARQAFVPTSPAITRSKRSMAANCSLVAPQGRGLSLDHDGHRAVQRVPLHLFGPDTVWLSIGADQSALRGPSPTQALGPLVVVGRVDDARSVTTHPDRFIKKRTHRLKQITAFRAALLLKAMPFAPCPLTDQTMLTRTPSRASSATPIDLHGANR